MSITAPTPTEYRAETDEDRPAVLALIRAAFGDEGDQVAAIWDGLGRRRRGGVVAMDGSTVVGHVGLSTAWLDARRALVDILLLSPLSVHPGWQGGGIGGRLLAEAKAAAEAWGAPMVVVEGDPGFYGAHGFEKASDHGLLPASARTPDGAFQLLRLDSAESWMAGRVVYPDLWWEHDAAGLRDPLLAELEERLGRSH